MEDKKRSAPKVGEMTVEELRALVRQLSREAVQRELQRIRAAGFLNRIQTKG